MRFRWDKLIGRGEDPPGPRQEGGSRHRRPDAREREVELRELPVSEEHRLDSSPLPGREVDEDIIIHVVPTPESPSRTPQRISPNHRPQVSIFERAWLSALERFDHEAPRKGLELARMQGLLAELMDLVARYEQMRAQAVGLHERLTAERERARAPLEKSLEEIEGAIQKAEDDMRAAEREFRLLAANCQLNVKEISLNGLEAAVNERCNYDPNRRFVPTKVPDLTPPRQPVPKRNVDWIDAIFAPICGLVFGVAFMTAFGGMNTDDLANPLNGRLLASVLLGPVLLFGGGILLTFLTEKFVRYFDKRSDTHREGGGLVAALTLPMLVLWIGEIFVEKTGLQMLYLDYSADLSASAIKLPPQPDVAFWFAGAIIGSLYFGLKLLKIEKAIASEVRYDHDLKEYEAEVRKDTLRVASEERAFQADQERRKAAAQSERDSRRHYDDLSERAAKYDLNRGDLAAQVERRNELRRRRSALDGPVHSPDLEAVEREIETVLARIHEGYERIRSLMGNVVVVPQIEWRPGEL